MSDKKGINLRELIREVAADMSDESTPHDIAIKVAESVPMNQVKALFVESLGEIVRRVVGFDRQASLTNVVKGGTSTPAKSAKLKQRRSWWEAMCESRVHIGKGEWKLIGSCTVDDLQFCIDERQQQIAQLNGQIVNFTALLDALERTGVETVSELAEGDVAA